ncbi:hypothetical protein Tco_0500237 [Tanacetum coccineum]
MSMTIQSDVKDKIIGYPSEESKVENAPAEMLRGLDQLNGINKQMMVVLYGLNCIERVTRRLRAMAMTIQYGVRGMILAAQRNDENGSNGEASLHQDAAESDSDTIRFEYYSHPQADGQSEPLYGRKCRSPVIWAEIGGSSLIGPELVQEMTNKVVLVKEKPKAAGDRQKSYADNRHKPLEFEILLYELRNGVVNDVVTQLKTKLLAVRYLVKVIWNSKVNFELTWVWEDYLKDKYPRLIVWLVKPLVLTYESDVMYGLCVYVRYVDYVRVGNQSIERDCLIGIGLVMDLVKFLSFTLGGKEMTFVVLAFLL